MTPVLLITTPGIAIEAYRPLISELEEAMGRRPTVVTFPCAGDAASMSRRIAVVVAEQPNPPVVVAHGIGATLALGAVGDRAITGWVLLAPVLGVPTGPGVGGLADRAVDAPVHLDRIADEASFLLGDGDVPLGCVPAALARDVQGWIRRRTVPLSLDTVVAPTWIGIGLLDDVSPAEVVVHESRRIPDRVVLRLGTNRLDPVDYDHLGMLMAAPPVTQAVRAVVGFLP